MSVPAAGDAAAARGPDNGSDMGNGTSRRKERVARLAATRYARPAAVALLAVAASAQAIAYALTLGGPAGGGPRPGAGGALVAAEYVLPLTLLALLATVPLAVYRPVTAAFAVTFGNAVALASFGQLTAGGALAELAAACWLGWAGGLNRAGGAGRAAASRVLGPVGGSAATSGRFLAVLLGLPFWLLALTAGGWAAGLLAALVPVAAGLGLTAWAGRLAQTRTAAGEALADTLMAHTARGERARIARELHDVVAHHISMIAVLSETGRLATPGLPEAGARRFAEIGDTARSGLTEMRRLLGVLREDAAAVEDAAGPAAVLGTSALGTSALGTSALGTSALGTSGLGASALGASATTLGPAGVPGGDGRRASRQPQPGLGQLTELVDAAREASAAGTRLIISGPVARLDPGVELAAYRIVQEALTNTRRHAPGAAVDVELRYSPDSLRLRVRDNGPGPASPAAGSEAVPARAADITAGGAASRAARPAGGGPAAPAAGGGHGLAGMRERAFSVGGSLYAGLAPGGGFLVEAVLPAGTGPAGLLPAADGAGELPARTAG